jgi:alpha-L-fucosidase
MILKIIKIPQRTRNNLLLTIFLFLPVIFAHSQRITIDRNKTEKVEWFRDMGFGIMINWSVDVQLGAVMSHNLAVASKEYQKTYFNDLPKTFYPKKFDPDEWAKLAKIAGVKYMVFTAKHHNGFCMWDTKTSDFNIINSGYSKDMLREIIEAFRKHNIAIGLSFAPVDFHIMHKQGYPPSLRSPEASSAVNTALWEINKNQLRELLTNYGKIDILYIDETSDWANPLVANFAWDLDPDVLVTRGGMVSYDQFLPKEITKEPWELSINMGYHRQFVGEENYKDAGALINLLIDTRAKGGNLLLNIGPDTHGEIPEAQEHRLREIGLWLMANNEAIENVRPWKIADENGVWFTQSKDQKIVYAFVNAPNWKWMEERAFFIRAIKGTKNTSVSMLGQNDEMMEYQVHRSPKPIFSIVDEGIFVNVVKAQRLNKSWDNPMVIRFEGVGE